MARKKSSFLANWQENYAGIILGAIIVIILGLLVANFFTNRNADISNGEQEALNGQEKMAEPEEYKVVAGDSLSKLAEKYYGDINLWPILARENKISNPNIIHVDSTLKIPSKDQAMQVKEEMTQTTYKVVSGDTLFMIAQKMYGDGSRWPELARANNLGRLPNGNPLVFADSTIKIPR